jgi:protocatechuate 3,4-dioxygenase beta subunit
MNLQRVVIAALILIYACEPHGALHGSGTAQQRASTNSSAPNWSAAALEAHSVIGRAGGTVSVSNGTSVTIPAGALSADTMVNVKSAPNAMTPLGVTAAGTPFLLTPEGQEFSEPVTVTLTLDPSMMSGATAKDVTIYTAPANTSRYVALPTTVVDDTHVQAQVSHFCWFFPGLIWHHGGWEPGWNPDTQFAPPAQCNSSGVPYVADLCEVPQSTAQSVGALPQSLSGLGAAIIGNYAYAVGGTNQPNGVTSSAAVYYSQLGAGGTLAPWSQTTSLPLGIYEPAVVANNGYLYVLGGAIAYGTGATVLSSVYYAKQNADGTLGAWNATTSLPVPRMAAASVALNGYLYIIGGNKTGTTGFGEDDSSYETYGRVHYAPFNADGTIGAWTSTAVLPSGRAFAGAATNGNFIYLVGGSYLAGAQDCEASKVLVAPQNPDGSLPGWQELTPFSYDTVAPTVAIVDNTMFVALGEGRQFRGGSQKVIAANLAADGTISGSWQQVATMPETAFYRAGASTSSAFYLFGGSSTVGDSSSMLSGPLLSATYEFPVVGGKLTVQGGVEVTNSATMEGNLLIQPGDTVTAGWDVTIQGPHNDTEVELASGTVTIHVTCPDSSVFPLVIPLPQEYIDTPYNDNNWWDSGDPGDPSVFQATATAPATMCGGHAGHATTGATFDGIFEVSTTNTVTLRWHYGDQTTEPSKFQYDWHGHCNGTNFSGPVTFHGSGCTTVPTITVGQPSQNTSSIVASPYTLNADGQMQSYVTVTVLDLNGAPAANYWVSIDAATVTVPQVPPPAAPPPGHGCGPHPPPNPPGPCNPPGGPPGWWGHWWGSWFGDDFGWDPDGGNDNNCGTQFSWGGGFTDGNGHYTFALSSTQAETVTIVATVYEQQCECPIAWRWGWGGCPPGPPDDPCGPGPGWGHCPPRGPPPMCGGEGPLWASGLDQLFNLGAVVTFVPGPISLQNSSLSANPGDYVFANGTASTTLTLTLVDANWNPIQNASVVLSSDGTGNSIWPLTGVTDATGTFVSGMSSTAVGIKNVTATINGTTQITTQVPFVAVFGSADSSKTTITATPAIATADGATPSVVTINVLDGSGNPVVNHTINVSLQATGGNVCGACGCNGHGPFGLGNPGANGVPCGTYLSAGSGVTDPFGNFSVNLTSTTLGTYNVTMNVLGTFSKVATVKFVPGPADSNASVFNASPSTVTADGVSAIGLTATLYDANGHIISGAPVTFSATGAATTITPSTGTSNSSGVVTASAVSTVAQSELIVLQTGSTLLTVPVTFVPGAPYAANCSMTVLPGTVVADGVTSSTVTVSVQDKFHNPISGQAISLTTTPGGVNQFGGPITNSAGIYTAALTSKIAGTYSVNAQFGSHPAVNLTGSVTFIAGPVSASASYMSASPSSLTVGGTTSLTLHVLDQYNNPIAGEAVTLAASGTSNTLTPTSGTTNASGLLTATLSSTKAQSETVTATGVGLNEPVTVTFVAGNPSSCTLVASPSSGIPADGSTQSTLTATILDSYGNPVGPGYNVSIGASPSTGTHFAWVVQNDGNDTDANGHVASYMTSTKSGTYTVTVNAGTCSPSTSVSFVPGPISTSKSTFTASPSSLAAGANSSLTVTLLDANSNPISGQLVTLSSTGSGNAFSPASGTTNASGVFTATFSSTKAEAKTITASAGTTNLSASVTVVPGAASSSNSSFSASPSSAIANGSAATTVSLAAADAYGNLITNTAVTLSASPSTGTHFSAASGNTNGSGVYSSTLTSTVAGSYTLSATIGSTVLTSSMTFVPGPVSSTNSSVAASPNTNVPTDGVTTSTVTVTLQDANHNAISGQAVSLSASGSGNTWGSTSGSTNASGQFVTTLKSSSPGTQTITATAGTTNLTTSITFVVGPPSSSTSTFMVSPGSQTANGSSTVSCTAVIKDASGNLINGQSVSLSASPSSGTHFTSASGTTSSGVFSTTLTSTVAAADTITMTAGSLVLTSPVTFVPGPVSTSTSTLVASPSSVTANGTSLSTVTMTVLDANSNPISGQAVSFAATGSGNSWSSSSGLTNSAGQFSATLGTTVAGARTITATVGTNTFNTSVTFVPGAISTGNSSFSTSGNNIVANGSSTATVTLTLEDAYGNLISGQSVSFSSTGSSNTITPSGISTNASGQITATIASTKAETKTVTATAGSTQFTVNITFVPGPISTSTSTFSASPSTNVTANGTATSTLTLTLKDASSNAISGQSCNFGATGSTNTFSPGTSGTTSGAGSVSFTLASLTSGAETVTATCGSSTFQTTVTFVAGPATAVAISASPSSGIPADGSTTSTITVTVTDAHGNGVPSASVSLGATPSTSVTFTPASGSTASNGVFTATVKSTVATTNSIKATVGSLSNSTNVTFVPGPISTSKSTFTASPTSLTHGSASTLTLTLKDANSNLISGQSVTLSGTPSTNLSFSPATGSTSGSGLFTATATSTVAQTVTIKATMGSTTMTTSVTWH